jgi:hypothetical protein
MKSLNEAHGWKKYKFMAQGSKLKALGSYGCIMPKQQT